MGIILSGRKKLRENGIRPLCTMVSNQAKQGRRACVVVTKKV